ncbi:hypothetical protein Q4I32_007711 [Leishmania shawi]|uniref:Peroxin-13 n=1 Tax=Leishmania shawi TaxID=5680 RepID=A0AAW3BAN7_9TRYP
MSSQPTAPAAAVAESNSPPGSSSSPTAPVSPTNSSLSPSAVLLPSVSTPLTSQTGALTVSPTSGTGQLAGSSPTSLSTDVTAANGGTVGAATASMNANAFNNGMGTGYGMGSGYGMGMDPYCMSGMYGGYGGLGMGGMYGGLGMMGMGGFGMGMTPEAQRAQMMMFMTSRIMELWGMFSQVMQITLGSAVQFVGEYVGITQRMGQLEEENLNHEERYMSRKYELCKALSDIPREKRYMPRRTRIRKPKKLSFLRHFIFRLLRHVVIFAAAYFLSKRVTSLLMDRYGKKLLSASGPEALASSTASKTSL